MKNWFLCLLLMAAIGLTAESSTEHKYGTDAFKALMGSGSAQLFPVGTKVESAGKDKVMFPADPKYSGIKIVTDQAGKYSTLGTLSLPVRKNAVYKIFFEARGNIKLTAYTYARTRKDFFVNLPLTEEWKGYAATVNIPADVSFLAVYLLNWQQVGWFEIRNFAMEPAQ